MERILQNAKIIAVNLAADTLRQKLDRAESLCSLQQCNRHICILERVENIIAYVRKEPG